MEYFYITLLVLMLKDWFTSITAYVLFLTTFHQCDATDDITTVKMPMT